MARDGAVYACQSCGAVQTKWSGQCAGCGAWNTLVEELTELIVRYLVSASPEERENAPPLPS